MSTIVHFIFTKSCLKPAEVQAHFREKEGTPFAANVIVIRFAPQVIEREAKQVA